MFQDAEDEVGGALARANLIAMIHTDHDDRQPVACIGSRPNGCELSGRGSLPHKAFRTISSPRSLDSVPASPVRSSELLARLCVCRIDT